MSAPDVAIAGGGIVGTALAALLAEAGATVRLYEREAIAAAASGRNSGALQHPLDEPLVAVYERSLALYETLGHGFAYPAEPVGVLVLSDDPESLRRECEAYAARFPEVVPAWLESAALTRRRARGRRRPLRVSPGGRPPGAAGRGRRRVGRAGARRRRGAGDRHGGRGRRGRGGRATGVRMRRGVEPAGTVVLAAGPWTAELAPAPVGGAVGRQRRGPAGRSPAPRAEQAGIDAVSDAGGGDRSLF